MGGINYFKVNPLTLGFLGALFNSQWHFRQFFKNKRRRHFKFLNAISRVADPDMGFCSCFTHESGSGISFLPVLDLGSRIQAIKF
jgi:hypothetical protein